MKKFQLKKQFKSYKKGTQFYLIAESEFIGIKEFVMRSLDLSDRIEVSEKELNNYFFEVNNRNLSV